MKVLQKPPRRGPRAEAASSPMPKLVPPMLAVLSKTLPLKPENYAYEYKWDGVRAIFRWDGNDLSLQSRNLLDITNRYPEIWPLAEIFGSRPVILDGEIIALDDEERPSFARLQRRMHVQDMTAVRRLMKEVPVFFVVFDVLWLDGASLMDQPWMTRRDRLEELELSGPAWLRSPVQYGNGAAVLSAAGRMKLEGVVAKKLDSPYRLGVRSPDWLKIKIVSDDEFVIGGWVPEAGNRASRVGSLLLGAYDDQGRLRFLGGVGTGFNDETHRRLTMLLKSLASTQNPFADRVPKRGAIFVKPQAVAQIEYRRRGSEGMLQQASFKGIRTDKNPKEIRMAG
jgi:bifunctional non-homologous end joining protein LigD